jgi:hypothetical protein
MDSFFLKYGPGAVSQDVDRVGTVPASPRVGILIDPTGPQLAPVGSFFPTQSYVGLKEDYSGGISWRQKIYALLDSFLV